jgi:RHS repeat-associated protein
MTITDYYVATDAMGSVTAILDDEGNVLERRSYDAFGEMTCMTPDGTPVAESPTEVDVGFQGQVRDQVTGLYQMGFRWLNPNLGRWISRDPIGLAGGKNHLTFADNNPAALSDPSGLISAEITINFKSAIGADLVDPIQHQFDMPTTSCEVAEVGSTKKKYMNEAKKATEAAKNAIRDKINRTFKELKGRSATSFVEFITNIVRFNFFAESNRKAYCEISINIEGLVECVGIPPKNCRINVQIRETTRNRNSSDVSASLNSTKTYYILSESDELTVALFAAEQRALDNAIAEFNTQMDACTKK